MSSFEPRRLRVSIEAFPVERELEPPPYCFEAGAKKPSEAVTGSGAASGGSRRRSKNDDEEDEEVGGAEGGGEGETGGKARGSAGEASDEDNGEEKEEEEEEEEGGGSGDDDAAENDDGKREPLEIAVSAAAAGVGSGRVGRGGGGNVDKADEVYDPCFVLPLLEWGLRTSGVTAKAVSTRNTTPSGVTRFFCLIRVFVCVLLSFFSDFLLFSRPRSAAG